MKTFIREFFASCLGGIATLLVVFGLIAIIVASMSDSTPEVKANSVLKLSFSKPIPELTNNVSADPSALDFGSLFGVNVGLTDICKLISIAKKDPNIKGIYLDMENVSGGFATMKRLRESLDSFKASGKFVIAYSNAYSQKSYYLASAAQKVYLHPMGGMDFMGFAGQIMYYKGLMDKVGVKAQIYYAGRFKSATEPFRRTDMSPENRKQVSEYIGGAYKQYLEVISKSRKISTDSLFQIADKAMIRNAADAQRLGLVDGLKYKDEIISDLKSKLGIKKDKKKKIEVIGLDKYYEVQKENLNPVQSKGNKIAVVYAEGDIVDGEGDQGSIGGEQYARIIREIREDEKVKAIVLRVNSGGGSALASEIIWREIELAKKQGIKVVTSMGDVAASGGYYIASNSDKIFAETNTITGSIGVFGMIPNTRELYNKHLGITMDTVKTGRFSTMSTDAGMYYEFNEEEGKLITESIQEIYDIFKTRVSVGRKLDRAHVDTIAEGRVWLGNVAKTIGLVDELGGLDQAIRKAASIANLKEYKISNFPKTKSFEDNLFSGLKDAEKAAAQMEILKKYLGSEILGSELFKMIRNIEQIKKTKGAQMRLPYEIIIQ